MTERWAAGSVGQTDPAAETLDGDIKNSTHSKIKNFLEEEEETENNSIERCCCCRHCCTDLRTTKILHENFRLGVVLGFGH